MTDKLISGSCHCGKITFTVSHEPQWLTECNCSTCRRFGALWARFKRKNVTVSGADDSISYIQGDKTLSVHTCSVCGCTTHWDSLSPGDDATTAVNFRMCEPELAARMRIRHFDGADSWAYQD